MDKGQKEYYVWTNTHKSRKGGSMLFFSFIFRMTTSKIIGGVGRGLTVDGLICQAKEKFRLDAISEKEQLNNRNLWVTGSELKMQEWLNAETRWAGTLRRHMRHDLGLSERWRPRWPDRRERCFKICFHNIRVLVPGRLVHGWREKEASNSIFRTVGPYRQPVWSFF